MRTKTVKLVYIESEEECPCRQRMGEDLGDLTHNELFGLEQNMDAAVKAIGDLKVITLTNIIAICIDIGFPWAFFIRLLEVSLYKY